MLVACVGPEVRVVWLALSEVVIDDRSEKRQHRHHDGKAHRPHSDKHTIHSRKSIALENCTSSSQTSAPSNLWSFLTLDDTGAITAGIEGPDGMTTHS